MSGHTDPAAVRRALAERLRVAAEVALDDVPAAQPDPSNDALQLLGCFVRAIEDSDDPALAWLLLVAATGTYPIDAEVRALRRRVAGSGTEPATLWLLDHAATALTWADPLTELTMVDRGVVVDVDYSARHDLSTGIQRVVRHLIPRWAAHHGVTLAAWGQALRPLGQVEADRVLRWSGPVGRSAGGGWRGVIVPWRSVVVLPEVPAPGLCPLLAAMAEHSGNAVSLVGYDAIPAVSADLLPAQEPERFVRYLTVVKHAAAVSAISRSAAEEFAGFVDMLPAQGLTGPVVTACPLPVDVPDRAGNTRAATATPQVLVVGSHEPRKNHQAVLFAAEVLWREGLAFELTFVGNSGWASGPFDAQVRRLARAGRAVRVLRSVGDGELVRRYREARMTVFPSLHEGYGLPVAESLAVGTPAITAAVGATLEIADDGGALAVDPRDDEALVAAMRSLLLDDALHADLQAAALARPARTWDDYADEAWEQLVEHVRPSSGVA